MAPNIEVPSTNPEDIKKILRDEASDDCLSCRIFGGGAFVGLGVYSWVSGMRNLEINRKRIRASGSTYGIGSRRLGIRGMSLALIGLGVYRWFY